MPIKLNLRNALFKKLVENFLNKFLEQCYLDNVKNFLPVFCNIIV